MPRTLIVIAMTIAIAIAAPAIAQPRDCGPLPAVIEGEAFAIDGDTLAMLSEGKRTPDIRLWGIQAPELRDRRSGVENLFGMMARAALADRLIEGLVARTTRCRSIEWDRFCRVVATCALSTPKAGEIVTERLPGDLGGLQILDGLAYVHTVYAARPDQVDRLVTYAGLEHVARRLRRGFWSLYAPPKHD